MVFEGLQNIFRGIAIPRAAKGQEFYKVLTQADFMTASVTAYAGKWNKIGDFTVPAQQEYEFGYGDVNHPDSAGRLYVYLKDAAGTEIKGKIRLTVTDANERVKRDVFEERSDVLHGSLTDKNSMRILERIPIKAREDDRLQVYLQPDADATVSNTQTVLYVPTVNTKLSRF